RRREAGEILVNAKPPVDNDVVYVHAAAEGTIEDRLQRREFVRAYRPTRVAGRTRTAIAWTTASSVATIIAMTRDGALPQKGFLKQEDVPLQAFLASDTAAPFRDGAV
ncbi:MAG: L-lysine dehydrogenase, partial [Pseudomonadota bacterium]